MFLKSWVEMGGFELNHHWHGINVLSILECALLGVVLFTLLSLFSRAIRRSKRLRIATIVAAMLSATAAYAANTALSGLSASGALAGANLIYVVQTVGVGGVKATMTQVATFINSLFSGDFTVTSGGVATLKNTGPGATGPLGSATVAPIVTIDAQGRVTGFTSATITPAIGSITGLGAGCATFLATPTSANLATCLTDETGTGANVFANGPTLIAPVLGTPASGNLANTTGFPLANLSGAGTGVLAAAAATMNSSAGLVGALTPTNNNCIVGNGSLWTSTTCPGGGGGASSVTGAIGVTCSPTTGAVICSTPATRRDNTATTDTITSTDKGTIVTESNASSVAVAITTAGFVSTDYFTVKNLGAGVATYTPSSGTINGAATLVCQQNQSADLYFDGANYKTLGNTCGLGALATTAPGTGVAAAAANNLSAAGGLTTTIFRGTATLGVSLIASGACATVVTVSATNVATTDVVTASYNSDPTAVTGYGASATGAVLSVYPYPTANNINVKVCNSSPSSITPGAMTLNVSAVR